MVRCVGRTEHEQVLKSETWLSVVTPACNDERELVATRELQTGDIRLMVSGGHGFRLIEDTVFLKIKQGPYTGLDEKERF